MLDRLKYIATLTVGAIATIIPPSTASVIRLQSTDIPLTDKSGNSFLGQTHWQLIRWRGHPLDRELPIIDIHIDADKISGSTGCNRYVSEIESDTAPGEGQNWQLGAIASTRRACEPILMDRETQYLQALTGVHKYSIDSDGHLWLAYQSDQDNGTLEFSPIFEQ